MSDIKLDRTRFDLRASSADAALIRQAASARGQKVTEFILAAVLPEARKALGEEHTITLSAESYEALQAELAKADQPIEALAKILKQPRRVKLPE